MQGAQWNNNQREVNALAVNLNRDNESHRQLLRDELSHECKFPSSGRCWRGGKSCAPS